MLIPRKAAALCGVGEDDPRYNLNLVEVSRLSDKRAMAAVTDGYRVIGYVFDPMADDEFPRVADTAAMKDLNGEAKLVTQTGLERACKAHGKARSTLPVLNNVRVGTIAGKALAVSTDLETPVMIGVEPAGEPTELRFPQWREAMPTGDGVTFQLGLSMLIDTLTRLRALADVKTSKKINPGAVVRFTVRPSKLRVKDEETGEMRDGATVYHEKPVMIEVIGGEYGETVFAVQMPNGKGIESSEVPAAGEVPR